MGNSNCVGRELKEQVDQLPPNRDEYCGCKVNVKLCDGDWGSDYCGYTPRGFDPADVKAMESYARRQERRRLTCALEGTTREALEAQARKLRATITRRKSVEAASCTGDNVAAIVNHYEQVLADVERQLCDMPLPSNMLEESDSQSLKPPVILHEDSISTACSSTFSEVSSMTSPTMHVVSPKASMTSPASPESIADLPASLNASA